ncbi:response regulator receiver domain protein [Synechococcus sp. PCC 7335]|uniref:hybrid sensor histidine kinase/response regulator n=1 Tax=Synechococcus sp. (strain ATCC 29403 / PCC 7335) TaxID=91464 RepID=UPI00017ECB05|nr:response regulator [Synechococcus sp. PCC 7335]EDX84798.1 response regulator receiver domain protein [Synechococcus sp. PCC 7335]
MLPEQQQRIMGYFIEEAKDHLNTIEQGLLNLQATIEDSEKANEIFRAAHSVKGGAAMLGLESIQKTAHRLEDYFKVLKESTLQVDRTLETMFLKVSDGLQDLVEQLEGSSGLTSEKAQSITAEIDPVFVQIDAHLNALIADNQDSVSPTDSSRDNSSANVEAIQVSFGQDVAALLRQMLSLFKQPDSPESRQELQTVCSQLTALGERFRLIGWCELLETARLATTNLEKAYRVLAPTLIKEIKNAQDLVLAGRESEIVASDAMRSLLPRDVLETEQASSLPETDHSGADELDSLDLTDQELDFDEVPSELSTLDLHSERKEEIDESLSALFATENSVAPDIGSEGLEDFADLFEDKLEKLDDTSESHVLMPEKAQLNPENLDQQEQDDIADLFTEVSLGEASSSDQIEYASPANDLFDETFYENSNISESDDEVANSESLSEAFDLPAFDQELLTAEEITAEGITSETLSSGFLSNQPTSPSKEEIEFPTLTGIKLNEAEEDVDSFFSESDDFAQADLLAEQSSRSVAGDDGDASASTNEDFDRLFASVDDVAEDAVEEDIEDSAFSFDELLPEDLLEFEEAFGKESTETTETDSTATEIFQANNLLEDSFEALPEADRSKEDSSDDFLEEVSLSEEQSVSENSSSDVEAPSNEPSVAPISQTDSSADAIEPNSKTEDFEGGDFEDLERLLSDDGEGKLRQSPSPTPSHHSGSGAVQRKHSTHEQTMRVPVEQLDNLSNLVGELVVNRNTLEKDQTRLRHFLDNLMSQVQQMNEVGQQMRDLYERSLLESSLVASQKSYAAVTSSTAPKAEGHATGATFDALEMDRFTGFHTLSQEMIELIVRLRESASDVGYTVESTDQVTRQFRHVTTELQEGLNKARMVPFSHASARLPRAVRDISIKCGKEATLVIEGEDTLIDKMIVERLYDPLTHLVNNAITHGIETPEQRVAAGKPPEGQITIKAFYQGNQTLICISDDGSGIDPDLVKRKAIEKKLITQAEAEELSLIEAYGLIFQPGFSTRDYADDFAGRGVGMDVVQTALAELHGVVTIDSKLGSGTKFTIRLPLTLSISKALCCISAQARIAFPMDGVEDMLDIGPYRLVKNEEEQDCIRWRESLLPVRPVADLLRFNRKIGRSQVYGSRLDDEMLSIVVLRSADTFVAVQVDQVLGEEEIVFKQLEGPVPKPIGISGATILGDGRVMPIADVLELVDIATGRLRREPVSLRWSESDETTEETKHVPTVLIVDDSITVRELLSMTFSKVGYRVEQARDGKEAWTKLQSGLPYDLVFCDIEMPRMDGLTLLSRMQKEQTLKQIPVAMLTSRGADRHRQLALALGASGYFTKPYLEEALLEAAQEMLAGEVQTKGQGS